MLVNNSAQRHGATRCLEVDADNSQEAKDVAVVMFQSCVLKPAMNTVRHFLNDRSPDER